MNMSTDLEGRTLNTSPEVGQAGIPRSGSSHKGRLGGVGFSAQATPTPSTSPLSGGELSATNIHPALWNEDRHPLGLAKMDATHREFVALVATLIDADADAAAFPALFQALVNHTATHFKAEGVLMRESKYRGLPEHEAEHHRVLGELQQLNRSLKRGHLPLVRTYVKEGLMEWFDTHVAMMDAALAMHLKKQQLQIASADS